jgi:hypothetical protein
MDCDGIEKHGMLKHCCERDISTMLHVRRCNSTFLTRGKVFKIIRRWCRCSVGRVSALMMSSSPCYCNH